MSPKISLAHGATSHLYMKTFEDDKIYLELSNVQFEANRDKYQMTGNAIEREFILVRS
ncbi:hypothetical protein ACO0LG_04605 [Undibacterium sp. Ji42W]|uniref:hypothetical protein n=1 Tax=Undibacterium sp. Ji42W TaxID=3413039 RepID=UPI003BF3F533